MPQLNPDGFLPQLFWLAITFITLYFIMARVSLPRVSRIREHRADRIEGDLGAAQAMKSEADAAKAAYQAALGEAKAKSQAITTANREAIKANAEARAKALGETIADEADEAAARIDAAKRQALSHVRDIATDAAREIVAKISGLKLDDAAVHAAVDAEIKNLTEAK